MSEIYVSLDAQGNGILREEPEIRAQVRQAVAAHREKQIEAGIRKAIFTTARKAAWIGRAQGALFVAAAVFLWWVGSQIP